MSDLETLCSDLAEHFPGVDKTVITNSLEAANYDYFIAAEFIQSSTNAKPVIKFSDKANLDALIARFPSVNPLIIEKALIDANNDIINASSFISVQTGLKAVPVVSEFNPLPKLNFCPSESKTSSSSIPKSKFDFDDSSDSFESSDSLDDEELNPTKVETNDTEDDTEEEWVYLTQQKVSITRYCTFKTSDNDDDRSNNSSSDFVPKLPIHVFPFNAKNLKYSYGKYRTVFLFFDDEKRKIGSFNVPYFIVSWEDNEEIAKEFGLKKLADNSFCSVHIRGETCKATKSELQKKKILQKLFKTIPTVIDTNCLFITTFINLSQLKFMLRKQIMPRQIHERLHLYYRMSQMIPFEDFGFNQYSPDLDYIIEQPGIMKSIPLKYYQLEACTWLTNVERSTTNGWKVDLKNFFTNLGCEYFFNDQHELLISNYDSDYSGITGKITCKGGIYSDAIGMGKTATIISLVLNNPCHNNSPFPSKTELLSEKLFFKTKATLIICPNHLAQQWVKEISKFTGKSLKCVTICTIMHAKKVTYKDILDADFVIVSFQLFGNKNYNEVNPPSIELIEEEDSAKKLKLEIFKYVPKKKSKKEKDDEDGDEEVVEDDVTSLRFGKRKREETKKNSKTYKYDPKKFDFKKILKLTVPKLDMFEWYRIVLDEGHEIFDSSIYPKIYEPELKDESIDQAGKQLHDYRSRDNKGENLHDGFSHNSSLRFENTLFTPACPSRISLAPSRAIFNEININEKLDKKKRSFKSISTQIIGLKGKYKWYMTGTPFPSNYQSLINALSFLEFKFIDGHNTKMIDDLYAYLEFITTFVHDSLYWRNTQESVNGQNKTPGITEQVKYLEFTEVERGMYEDAKRRDNELRMRQICCHPQISDEDKQTLGCQSMTLDEIKDSLVKDSSTRITKLEKQIETKKKYLNKYGQILRVIYGYERNEINTSILEKVNQIDEENESDEELELYENEESKFINGDKDNEKLPEKLTPLHELDEKSKEASEKCKTYLRNNRKKLFDMISDLEKTRISFNFFSSIEERIDDSESKQCAICFDEDKDLGVLPCGHFFCFDCSVSAVKSSGFCPLCRSPTTVAKIVKVSKDQKIPSITEFDEMIKNYGTKLANLIKFLNELLESDSNARIIIFCQWDDMLNKVGETLTKNGISNVFCKGNVFKRNKALEKFQTDKKTRCLLLSLDNAASGLNLTEASHVILLNSIDGTREHACAIESQATGRANRMGQTKKVKVIRFIIKGTIEEDYYLKLISPVAKNDSANLSSQISSTLSRLSSKCSIINTEATSKL